MALIVQKYGGTSVGTVERIQNVARRVKKYRDRGDNVVVVGIGTILNDNNAERVASYHKKVVFSSGAGYGTLDGTFDDSWDFVCVRGPNTRNLLKLEGGGNDADGAVLLSNFYPTTPRLGRNGVVFIPHVNTDYETQAGFTDVCE